ncbi:hypothetical protein OH492_23975 [Vibrio chagasii]|nr:hypothetical protein [Vibrio chagasii]
MIKVEDMMTRNPHTLLRSHSLADALSTPGGSITFTSRRADDRKLLGVVTQRDVLAAKNQAYKTFHGSSFTLSTPLSSDIMHKALCQ